MPQKPARGACTTYRRAKDEELPRRSAFKLMDIDDAYGLLRGAKSVVDLCAAPGSWCRSETTMRRPNCKIVGICRRRPCSPLTAYFPRRHHVTRHSTKHRKACSGKADVIICDGAPEVSGLHDADEHAHDALLVCCFARL